MLDKPIATPSKTKEILEKFGLYAKKNYGQNFLVDAGVVEKIARSAIVSDHCVVFEIGPGIGALTQYLCQYAKHVVCFEIDERLPNVLAYSLQEYDNYEIILQDFLRVDLQKYVDQYKSEGMDVVIAANLPYYITTPILFKIFEADVDIDAITVMMQKEVADRFYADIATKEYNALSVITQYRCDIHRVMKVPKNVFMPKPNVDSAVLQFHLKHPKMDHEEDFFSMIKACFKQRRKTIYNNFSSYIDDKGKAENILLKAGIDLKARAETISLSQFHVLFEVMKNEGICICEN